MNTTEIPETDKLSNLQREALLTFVDRADSIIGDGSFDRDGRWEDCELMALALRAAGILGVEAERLEQLFRDEFGLVDVKGDMKASTHRAGCREPFGWKRPDRIFRTATPNVVSPNID